MQDPPRDCGNKPSDAVSESPAEVLGEAEDPADSVDIPGWNSNSGDTLERHGAAEDKTRVTIARTPNQNTGRDVIATVEYDFELIFLPDKTIMGAWSALPGQTFTFNTNYTVDHLTLTETCTLPRNWDIGSPSNQ